jgi:hypothetical protein
MGDERPSATKTGAANATRRIADRRSIPGCGDKLEEAKGTEAGAGRVLGMVALMTAIGIGYLARNRPIC